ncbi:hypothetical protein HYW40_02620 [Candidatus Curtissbacteria bacterium]|nr:hypothetical protein [Candidatus Curtissbacteria bacterium]
MQSSETPGKSDLTSKDQVSKWIETGFSPEAVVVYGTTVETLNKILRTGEIPHYLMSDLMEHSRPHDLESVRKTLDRVSGKKLYFGYPLLSRLEDKPEFIDQFKEAMKREDISDFSDDFFLDLAVLYANNNVIEDYFEQKTGKKYSAIDLLTAAKDLVPEEFNEYIKERPWIDIDVDEEGDEKILYEIKREFGDEKASEVLAAALKRRGVLLFFNRELLENTDLIPGFEDEHEIVVASDKPLTITAIAGIKVLSGVEKDDLLRVAA